MPLTTPPGASAPLYARNKLTGETYYVGSSVEGIDDLIDVDTSSTGPTGGQVLVWDETLSQWVPGSQASSINDLTDVTTSSTGPTGPSGPTDGQVLVWDAALGQWIPGSQASGIDDLTDVDTATTGPTGGSALIWDETLGQWVPGVASTVASLDDLTDVTTSATGPSGPTGPSDGAVLMWDETVGQWIPGPGASEVEIGATMPTGAWELWVDEATELPTGGTGGGGGPAGPIAFDDLTDVDTSTTAPVDGDGLVWDATAGLWVPGAGGDFLPLAGGTLDAGAIVNFAEEVGDKIVLFPAASARFGFGVQSGRLEYFVTNIGNKHSFMVGGTERAFIDQNGIGPRSTVSITWVNSFTGSLDFRVNPSMVTMRMGGVNRNDGIDVGQDLQVCALPAGVPAPWASVATTIASTATGAVANTPVEVEVRSTGVWLKNIGGGYAWGPWKASITWSR